MKFYGVIIRPVSYGDKDHLSTIDPTGELKRMNMIIPFTLQRLTFIDYLFRAKERMVITVYSKRQFLSLLFGLMDLIHLPFSSSIWC